jgi:hypothetical protein
MKVKPERPIRNFWKKTPMLSDREVAKFFEAVSRARYGAVSLAKSKGSIEMRIVQ